MLRHLAMTVGWAVGTLSLVGLSVGAEPVDIGSNRELMLDDHLFSSMQRLGFRQHRPVEREMSLDFSEPWEGRKAFGFSVTGYATVLTEPGRLTRSLLILFFIVAVDP